MKKSDQTPMNNLRLSQIERRLKSIRASVNDTRVKPGWIHFMRQGLGMTLGNLAKRARLSISTIAQAERREAEGKVTLNTLKQIAHAMECEFIYAFVPKAEIQVLLKEKAIEKAKKILSTANTHMQLEDQQVEQSFAERVERLADQLLKRGDIW